MSPSPHRGLYGNNTIDKAEHDDIDDIPAKKVLVYGYDTDGATKRRLKVGADGKMQVGMTDNQSVELINALRVLITAIANPSYVDKSANAIRNQVQSGTITTVTTVTGITNLDGYQAKLPVINQNNAAWAVVVRARIS